MRPIKMSSQKSWVSHISQLFFKRSVHVDQQSNHMCPERGLCPSKMSPSHLPFSPELPLFLPLPLLPLPPWPLEPSPARSARLPSVPRGTRSAAGHSQLGKSPLGPAVERSGRNVPTPADPSALQPRPHCTAPLPSERSGLQEAGLQLLSHFTSHVLSCHPNDASTLTPALQVPPGRQVPESLPSPHLPLPL